MSAWLYPSRQISRINFTKKLTMFLFFYISFTKPTPGKRVPAFVQNIKAFLGVSDTLRLWVEQCRIFVKQLALGAHQRKSLIANPTTRYKTLKCLNFYLIPGQGGCMKADIRGKILSCHPVSISPKNWQSFSFSTSYLPNPLQKSLCRHLSENKSILGGIWYTTTLSWCDKLRHGGPRKLSRATIAHLNCAVV